MRVIAGEYGGRRLLGPKDDRTTRPITDRVKQSVCDRLASHGYFDGGLVLDVFCGTGSLGLEALSRGAEHVVFVDRDTEAILRLERNLATLEAGRRATVCRMPAYPAGWLHRLPRAVHTGGLRLSCLLLDPPYALVQDEAGLGQMVALMHAVESLAVAEPEGADEGAEEGQEEAEEYELGQAQGQRQGDEDVELIEDEGAVAEEPPGTAVVLRVPRVVDPPTVPGWRGPRAEVTGNMKVAYYVWAPESKDAPAPPDTPETPDTSEVP